MPVFCIKTWIFLNVENSYIIMCCIAAYNVGKSKKLRFNEQTWYMTFHIHILGYSTAC